MKKSLLAVTLAVLSGVALANDPVPGEATAGGGTTIDGSLNSNIGNTVNDTSYSTYENSSTYNDSSTVSTTTQGDHVTNNYEGALVTQNNSTVRSQAGSTAASAIAPSMGTSGYDSCSQAISGGAAGPGFGLSLGKHVEDDTCEIIKLTKLLHGMGFKDAALALAMQDKRVARAFRVANPAIAAKLDVRKDGKKFREEYAAEQAEQQEEAERLAERQRFQRQQEEDHQAVLAELAKPTELQHVFRKGDTLWSIAREHANKFPGSIGNFVTHIQRSNPGMNPLDIDAGTIISLGL